MSTPLTIAEAAAAYAARGWKPVPVRRKDKKAIGKGWQKRPFSPAQFDGNALNVAIQLGEPSGGLTDIDLDSMLAIGLAPQFLPPTGAIFGRRSKPCSHQLYVTNLHTTENRAAIQFKDGAGVLVELRMGGNGKGATTVVPPSMNATGEMVDWVSNGEPARVDGATLKRAVLKLAVATLLLPHYPGHGSRHEGALVLGGVLARAGWQPDEIAHVVEVLAQSAEDDDVADRVETAAGAVNARGNGTDVPGLTRLGEVWGDDAAKTLAKWLTLRDLRTGSIKAAGLEDAAALDFAAQHADDYRYVAASGKWLRWADSRWETETTLFAFDQSRTVCRAAGDARAKTVAAVVTLARTDRRIAATVAQWDRDPDIIATPGATVDLRTGQLRAPERSDYITKLTGCAVAPEGTPHPRWSTFLNRVTDGDVELQRFLQRYLGYCLTGHVSEHAFVFAYGTGANGKGTFIGTLAKIFGDYTCVADTATFIASNQERHPTDIAKLCGARLVVAQETQKGRRWDEAKIKTLTGGDKLTGRFMRQDYFDFDPTHKLFIIGNHKPRLTTVDEAMRRRLLFVPFTVQILAAERDSKLAHKLEAEHPAILRWAVDGCLGWRRIGLAPPDSIRAATEAYLADQDTVGQWLDEEVNTKAGDSAFIRTADLFAAWRGWCEKRNLRPGSEKSFSESLADRGYIKKRHRTGRAGFVGIDLKTESAISGDEG
jgi:putative DNA primase/helicase